MLDSLPAELTKVLANWKLALNDPNSIWRLLALPIIVAGISAFFGTTFASKRTAASEKSKRDIERVGQLVQAAAIAASVCNTLLSLKRQHVEELVRDFNQQRTNVVRELGMPTVAKSIHVFFTLQTISPPRIHTQQLVDRVVGMTQVNSVDVLQAHAVHAAVDNVLESLKERNSWISNNKVYLSTADEFSRIALVFGIPDGTGSSDQTYKDLVENIGLSLDDSIFHSYELYKRLQRNAIQKRLKLSRTARKNVEILVLDFSEAKERNLFPSPSRYQQWLTPPVVRKKPFFKSAKAHAMELLDRI